MDLYCDFAFANGPAEEGDARDGTSQPPNHKIAKAQRAATGLLGFHVPLREFAQRPFLTMYVSRSMQRFE